jgi:hypothetical protein
MLDTTHPSALGADVYSQYIMDTIAAPEPSSWWLLGASSSLVLLRRR